MLRPPQHRGPLFYLLVLATVSIWGYVAVQVVRYWAPPAIATPFVTAPLAVDTPAQTPKQARYAYTGDFRDPFTAPRQWFGPPRQAAPPAPRTARPTPKPPPVAPPQLHLRAVIGSTAMLHDAQGTAFFVHVGDSILTARLLEIHADSVILSVQQQPFTLKINS